MEGGRDLGFLLTGAVADVLGRKRVITAAMLASAAKNRVRRPRLIRPAAASADSSSKPSPLEMPPLAYIIVTIITMSAPTCNPNCR